LPKTRICDVGNVLMSLKLAKFKADETGAITADYVVLAGAIIALGLSAANAIRLGTFESNGDSSLRSGAIAPISPNRHAGSADPKQQTRSCAAI